MPRILSLMRWITAIATAVILALLAWQCIDIYLDGNAPENLDANGVHLNSVYRMDDVADRLAAFSVPLICYVMLLVVCGGMHLFSDSASAGRSSLSPENRLRLMKSRITELPAAAKLEERRRICIRIAGGIMIAGCAVPCLMYLLDGVHFTSWDLETVMGNMMLHVAPWCVAAFAAAIIAALLCGRSMEREINALKGVPVKKKAGQVTGKENSNKMIRVALYALAVVFIVLGVMNGGLRDVLVKAINICTECIGLG